MRTSLPPGPRRESLPGGHAGDVGSLSAGDEDPQRELEDAARGLEAALEGLRKAQRGDGPVDLQAARAALEKAERQLRRARERLRSAGGLFAQEEAQPGGRADDKD